MSVVSSGSVWTAVGSRPFYLHDDVSLKVLSGDEGQKFFPTQTAQLMKGR